MSDQRARSCLCAVVVASAVLVGGASLAPDDGLHPDVEALGTVWSAISTAEQTDICESIDEAGLDATARRLAQDTRFDAPTDAVEDFLGTLACHIQVRIGSR